MLINLIPQSGETNSRVGLPRRSIWYNCYTHAVSLRWAEERAFKSKPEKRRRIRRGAGRFLAPILPCQRSDLPEQYWAIGWVGEQLYTVIFEVREDKEGEYYHLVTPWKATKQDQQLYGEHS